MTACRSCARGASNTRVRSREATPDGLARLFGISANISDMQKIPHRCYVPALDGFPMRNVIFQKWIKSSLELGNAGTTAPIYYEHLLRFSGEYLAQFPDEEGSHLLNMLRSQGEALWFLGRRPEAE